MTPHANEFRRCLVECDVAGARRLWLHVSPHLPQPQTDDEARVMLHMARTQASSVAFKLRAYSHSWLGERGLPSQLPDNLRPSAERLYPHVVSAVGISVVARSPEMVPVAQAVERAMSDVVEDCYALGDTEPGLVRSRMMEARKKERQRIFGRIGLFNIPGGAVVSEPIAQHRNG